MARYTQVHARDTVARPNQETGPTATRFLRRFSVGQGEVLRPLGHLIEPADGVLIVRSEYSPDYVLTAAGRSPGGKDGCGAGRRSGSTTGGTSHGSFSGRSTRGTSSGSRDVGT